MKLCIGNLKFGEMEFGEMKRNTSNWSNFCILLSHAGLSASAGLSCFKLYSETQLTDIVRTDISQTEEIAHISVHLIHELPVPWFVVVLIKYCSSQVSSVIILVL